MDADLVGRAVTGVDWYVCDMDDGVLRREPTRREAVRWMLGHLDAAKVVSRYVYGPGYYGYVVGHDVDDCCEQAIVREDRLSAYGIDTAPGEITPVYPT